MIYRSCIPPDARPRVKERGWNGAPKRVEYFRNRRLVGSRWYDDCGNLACETPIRDGRAHGTQYWWFEPGWLQSTQPYRNGRPHGVARQWDRRGRLVGTYRMVNGTGVDLWWHDDFKGGHYLSEVHYWREGVPHGLEWWLNEDGTVYIERCWRKGELHGIEREWSSRGLRRGYPRFWVDGQRIDRRTYERRAAADRTLPPFRRDENRPVREFPAIVLRAMRRNRGRR